MLIFWMLTKQIFNVQMTDVNNVFQTNKNKQTKTKNKTKKKKKKFADMT